MAQGYPDNAASAFSNTLTDFAAQQAVQKQREFMNQLELRRLAMEEERNRALEAEHADTMAQRKAESLLKQHETEEKEADKLAADHMPSDIITDPRSRELLAKYHPGLLTHDAPTATSVVAPAPPTGTPPVTAGMPAAMPQATNISPGAVRFTGTPKQRETADTEKKIADLTKTLSNNPPDSPAFKQAALEYEKLGHSVPAALLGGTTGAAGSEAVMRQNPRGDGPPERHVNGQWVPWTGDVPKGAHWETQQPPKDTSAKDARAEALRNQAYNTRIKEIDDTAKPIKATVDSINELGVMLNAHTREADTLIAPLVLKSTVSGTGSGFRMTRPEIEKVAGGRDRWASLELALNRWSRDPSKPLEITEEQRTELRNIAKAIRDKAQKKLTVISQARHKMDDATTIEEYHKIGTKLQDDLYEDDTTESSTSTDKVKKTPKQIMDAYRARQ